MRKIVLMMLAAVLAMAGCTTHEQTPAERAIVRVAVGMDPVEVARRSTYPLDFDARGQPFTDKAFQYGGVIVTENVDFEVLNPHPFRIENVRYWGINVEFDEVDAFDADTPSLTLDEAIARAKDWVAKIDASGWQRQGFLYSMPKREPFHNWDQFREAFLLPGQKKAIGATVGIWNSADGTQMLIVGLVHKRPDGGPRYEATPDPVDPLNDRTYLLDFSVGYSDKVRAYRGAHFMELREQALQRKSEVRKAEKPN